MSKFWSRREKGRTSGHSDQHVEQEAPHDGDRAAIYEVRPDEAILQQSKARQWQQVAERQEEIVQLLHASAIRQREIVESWESLDPQGVEAKVLEDTLQQVLQSAVRLVSQALDQEQRSLHEAAGSLQTRQPAEI